MSFIKRALRTLFGRKKNNWPPQEYYGSVHAAHVPESELGVAFRGSCSFTRVFTAVQGAYGVSQPTSTIATWNTLTRNAPYRRKADLDSDPWSGA